MGALAVAVLVILVLLVIGFFVFMIGVLTKSSAAGHINPDEAAESAYHVSYLVPEGQDPAVVRAALKEAGYDSAAQVHPEGEILTIVLHDGTGADKERVREVLANERATFFGGPQVVHTTPVRFVDESP
ncbi:MAG TPA: hypothetical protein VFO98_15035 [Marmoricola sp.]|jgi:hypothetical protein|nr:hypothetical protein [Marmoricola sp.]